jgi:RNA polymerase sigma factor (sigma-70 family)
MTELLATREERRSHFVRRFLALAPKLTLAVRSRMPTGADDAVDVIQEVLVDLLEQIETSESPLLVEKLPDRELSHYLVRTVRNRLIDRKRRDEIKQRSYQELLRAIETPPSPEQVLLDSERVAILRQSITALGAPYRELLEALIEEDTTLSELARRRNIKIGTIHTQFQRAIVALKEQWRRQTRPTSRPNYARGVND